MRAFFLGTLVAQTHRDVVKLNSMSIYSKHGARRARLTPPEAAGSEVDECRGRNTKAQ